MKLTGAAAGAVIKVLSGVASLMNPKAIVVAGDVEELLNDEMFAMPSSF